VGSAIVSRSSCVTVQVQSVLMISTPNLRRLIDYYHTTHCSYSS